MAAVVEHGVAHGERAAQTSDLVGALEHHVLLLEMVSDAEASGTGPDDDDHDLNPRRELTHGLAVTPRHDHR